MWPTPGAAKANSDVTLTCSGDGRNKPNKLGWAVAESLFPTSQYHDFKNGTSYHHGDKKQEPQPRHISGGKLSAAWVCLLMGYPSDWLDL